MKMKTIRKIQYIMAVAVITALLPACSDKWDDHYSEDTAGNGTLWEAVSVNGELGNFARVVKVCGYDRQLSGSQAYSVFAPVNAAFTEADADKLIRQYEDAKTRKDDNPVVRQFLQNHIALYIHPVSELTNDTLLMMNGKFQTFSPTAVGGRNLLSSNGKCSNGVLFTVEKPIDYFPNVLEYMGQDSQLDSVYRFITSLNRYEFDPSKSVPGDIVDGHTVYLDSVSTLYNHFLSEKGYINREDSNYWMLAPTNEEWKRLVTEYESYFNYSDKVAGRDSMQHLYAREALLMGAIFNRTDNPEQAFRDSAVSTDAYSRQMRQQFGFPATGIYYKPFDAGGVFEGTERVVCSNGQLLKASDYRINKRNTFLQTIKVEAEGSVIDTLVNSEDPITVRMVEESNPYYGKISGNAYVDIVPKTFDVNPDVTFKVDNVLSNVPYDVYVVMAPVKASDINASAENCLGNKFRAYVPYTDQTGKVLPNRRGMHQTTGEKIDTLLLLKGFRFPVSGMSLNTNVVGVRLSSIVQANETTKFSRTLHVDCILLVPNEED